MSSINLFAVQIVGERHKEVETFMSLRAMLQLASLVVVDVPGKFYFIFWLVRFSLDVGGRLWDFML